MSDALQAAADAYDGPASVHDEPWNQVKLRRMANALVSWLEHPDVAGCDCKDGRVWYPQGGPHGVGNHGACTLCVVVTVGGIDNVRVRRESIQWLKEGNTWLQMDGLVVPAEGVDDE